MDSTLISFVIRQIFDDAPTFSVSPGSKQRSTVLACVKQIYPQLDQPKISEARFREKIFGDMKALHNFLKSRGREPRHVEMFLANKNETLRSYVTIDPKYKPPPPRHQQRQVLRCIQDNHQAAIGMNFS